MASLPVTNIDIFIQREREANTSQNISWINKRLIGLGLCKCLSVTSLGLKYYNQYISTDPRIIPAITSHIDHQPVILPGVGQCEAR